MNQIAPQRTFNIVWNSADAADSSTLYVQAKVYDTATRNLLNTVNLTDRGSNLFTGSFTTPADTSQLGTGRQIYIVKTVYTDSGYSTLSDSYARITDEYIVKALIDSTTLLGGGGGVIDYRELKKALGEVLAEKNIDVEVPQKVDYPVVLKQDFPIQSIKDAVKNGVDEIRSMIDSMPHQEMPKMPDMSIMENKIQILTNEVKKLPKETFNGDELVEILYASFDDMKKVVKDSEVEKQGSIVSYLNENKVTLLPELIEGIAELVSKEIKENLVSIMLGRMMGQKEATDEVKMNYLNNLKKKYV